MNGGLMQLVAYGAQDVYFDTDVHFDTDVYSNNTFKSNLKQKYVKSKPTLHKKSKLKPTKICENESTLDEIYNEQLKTIHDDK